MKTENYEAIARKLEILDGRLQEAGLSEHDRMRTHICNIRDLAQAQRKGTLIAKADAIDRDGQLERIFWSFVEGLELAEAMESLIAQGCPPPIAVLERALHGPVEPSLENERNNLGRNTMFEIVFAGDLAAAGLKPQLGSEPDITFEMSNRRLLVACKRPLSASAIAKQVEIAASKLGRNLQAECNPGDCGLIAISVTRTFTTGDQLLQVANEAQLVDHLGGELQRLANQHLRRWRGIKHPKIAGVLLRVSTPGLLVEENLLITAAQTLLVHIAGKSDVDLLEGLGAMLKAKVTQ